MGIRARAKRRPSAKAENYVYKGRKQGRSSATGASKFCSSYMVTVGSGSTISMPILSTLVNFNVTDRSNPFFSGLIADAAGDLFGTTQYGGAVLTTRSRHWSARAGPFVPPAGLFH